MFDKETFCNIAFVELRNVDIEKLTLLLQRSFNFTMVIIGNDWRGLNWTHITVPVIYLQEINIKVKPFFKIYTL